MNDVSRELGGALGIAVLGSVLNDAYRSGVAEPTASLPPEAAEHATSSLPGAMQVAETLGAQGAGLVTAAQAAFMDGLTLSMVVGAIVLALGAAFVALRAPGRAESRANAGSTAHDSALEAA